MRRAGLRIVLLLGVLGVVLSGAPAGALILSTVANLLTAPPPNGPNDAPNCNLSGAGGPTTCTTSAGTATAAAALWSLGGLASTQGTAASATHRAAAIARFTEDVSAPGAPAGATLVATFDLTGAITTAAGATGLVLLSFSGATVLSAPNAVFQSPSQVRWDFDQSSAAAFSETVVVQWALTGGSIPGGLSVDMSMSVDNTGFALDFLNTFELDKLEAFDAGENPIALDLFDAAGGLIGTTVPEPAAAILLALGLAGVSAGARHRRTDQTSVGI